MAEKDELIKKMIAEVKELKQENKILKEQIKIIQEEKFALENTTQFKKTLSFSDSTCPKIELSIKLILTSNSATKLVFSEKIYSDDTTEEVHGIRILNFKGYYEIIEKDSEDHRKNIIICLNKRTKKYRTLFSARKSDPLNKRKENIFTLNLKTTINFQTGLLLDFENEN